MTTFTLRNSKVRRTASALCAVSLGLLLQACGADRSEATAPAGDALYQSQHPVGEDFQTRLLGFEGSVTAVVKGDHAFVGDMVIGRLEGEKLVAPDQQVLLDMAQGSLSVQGSGIINAAGQKWPEGVIPYVFDADASSETRRKFLEAKADYDAKTQIRFVPRSNQANYVNVRTADGCYSYVGTIGGKQDLSIGSGCDVNAARHEMGHAVGLAHEQVRQDRDKWVTVNAGGSQNAIDYGSAGVPIGPYDFQSMMHYRNYFVNGRWDYVPKTGFPPERVGNDEVNSFTQGDLAAIAAIYGYDSGGGDDGGDNGGDNGGGLGNSVACFYYDINYGGKALCAGAAGQFGRVAADWNDRASSVKVAPGYEVQVFRDGDFSGGGYVLGSNSADFRSFSFNDLMSSFKISKK